MRTKLLLIFLVLTVSVSSFGSELKLQTNMSEIHSRIIRDRGAEQIREQFYLKVLGKNGQSSSNQYLELYFKHKNKYDPDNDNFYDYDTKTKGFMMGTTSNYLKYPDLRIGVDYGYLKSYSKFKDPFGNKTKTRTHGLNMFLGYNPGDWQLIGKIGYSQSRNRLTLDKIGDKVFHERNYLVGMELGHYFSLGDFLGLIYPYVGINYTRITNQSYSYFNDYKDDVVDNEVGLTYYKDISDKFLISINLYYSHEYGDREKVKYNGNKFDRIDIGNNLGGINLSVGYYYDPDLLITAKYHGYINKNFYYDTIGIGLSHNF